jgi:hypothetical protein
MGFAGHSPRMTNEEREIERLEKQLRREQSRAANLIAVLRRYIAAYPAFRIKPEGAPGSPVRVEQERLMELEDLANAAIAYKGKP